MPSLYYMVKGLWSIETSWQTSGFFWNCRSFWTPVYPDIFQREDQLSAHFLMEAMHLVKSKAALKMFWLKWSFILGEAFITPYSNRRDLSPEERQWNRFVFVQYVSTYIHALIISEMCAVRIASEWGIGRITNLFTCLDFKVFTLILLLISYFGPN